LINVVAETVTESAEERLKIGGTGVSRLISLREAQDVFENSSTIPIRI
jgi:hypothetical protein